MPEVFADTGYWIALLNRNDSLNTKARELSVTLQDTTIVTTEMVLTELLNNASSRGEGAMTPYEQELLEKCLAHQNIIGNEGDYPDFESWYQAVLYAQGPGVPATLEEASELRYKDVLHAARVFNRLQENRH